MEAKYKIYTAEADAIADRDHITKLKNADGFRYPQTADMLKRGRKCGPEKIPDSKLLAKFGTDYYRSPNTSVSPRWMMVITPYIEAKHGAYDPATGHTLDMSAATPDLPPDWSDSTLSP